jgi:hypothetical protein
LPGRGRLPRDLRDHAGATPLDIARRYGFHEAVEMLTSAQ